MGLPVKISDDLVLAARLEAKAASRSVTGQIEHWAHIGRAAEILMAHSELLGLKDLSGVFSPGSRREEVQKVLSALVQNPGAREQALALIHKKGAPVYETDSNHPGHIIQVLPNGKRVTGRFKNRQFVPEETLKRLG